LWQGSGALGRGRELSSAFGLTHPDSVRNLIRRIDCALVNSRPLRAEIEAIRQRVLKTEPDPAKPFGFRSRKPLTGSDPAKPLWV
jgi:hypothetical protein